MIKKTPINQFTSQVYKDGAPSYKEISAGKNYQKDDGSFEEAYAQIVPSSRQGIDWECFTTYNRVGFKNNITDGNYTIFSQIGNTGKILKSKIVGIAYLNIDTKEWEMIATLNSSQAVVNGNSIRYNNVFPDADIEYVIEKDRLKQNWHINQKHLPASPYPVEKTAVVIVTKMDLANYELPKFVVNNDTGEVDFDDVGMEAIDEPIKFAKQHFIPCSATDNNGDEQKIRKRFVKKNGEYYLLEGIPYNWLDNAAYPVLFDYTTVSSNLSGNQSWTSGTYYVTGTLTCSGTITVSAGVVVKFASGASLSKTSRGQLWDINGTIANPVYVTSENDDSVGDEISGSSGSPAIGDYVGMNRSSGDAASDISDNIAGANIQWGTYVTPNSWAYNNKGTAYFSDCIIGNFTYGITNSEAAYATHSYFFNIANGNGNLSLGGSSYGLVFYNVGNTSGQCCSAKTTGTAYNILMIDCGVGIYGYNQFSHLQTVHNVTAVNCSKGAYNGAANWGWEGSLTITDSIFKDCDVGIERSKGTVTSEYNNFYNNTTDYSGTITSTSGDLTESDPDFETGTMSASLTGILDNNVDDYFLNQSTSPCVSSGSDTASNLGVDGDTTSTDKTTDSGDVDMGFHYDVADVGSSAASVDIDVSVLTATFSVQSPAVSIIKLGSVEIAANVLTAAFSVQSPTISIVKSINISVGVLSASFSVQSPTTNIIKSIEATPNVLTATFNVNSPSVSVGAEVSIIPSVVTATFNVQSPVVSVEKSAYMNVNVLSASFSVQNPSVEIEKSVEISTNVLSATFNVQSPSVNVSSSVEIGVNVLSATFSVQSPSVTITAQHDKNISVKVLVATFSVQSPSVTVTFAVAPSGITITMVLESRIEKVLTYNSLMSKMYVGKNRISKTLLQESSIP